MDDDDDPIERAMILDDVGRIRLALTDSYGSADGGRLAAQVDAMRLDLLTATACIAALLDAPTAADIEKARALLAELDPQG